MLACKAGQQRITAWPPLTAGVVVKRAVNKHNSLALPGRHGTTGNKIINY